MPRGKHAVVAPEKVRTRLIQQVPPGTAGAFRDSVFGSWWITTASRGLNGVGGFISIDNNRVLNDSSEFTLEIPPVGSDGRNNRDRLYLFNDTPDSQLATPGGLPVGDIINYMPGDEWIEIIRGVNDLVASGTPISEQSSPSVISIVCRDATTVLKKTKETSAGYWRHAPRDVFEHYTRAWQTNLAENFTKTTAFSSGTASLVGSSFAGYSNADYESTGQIEALQFTASATGTVDTLHFLVATVSGTGSLFLGILADSGGSPGAVIGQGSVANPTAGAWATVGTLSIPVVAGTTYWLAYVTTGTLSISHNISGSGGSGTALRLSTDSSNTSCTVDGAGWGATNYANGPAGFYGSSGTGGVGLSSDGRWQYVGVAGITADILSLQVPAAATTAHIGQDGGYPPVLDFGAGDHGCWRAECAIVTANIPGAGATATVTFGVAPAGGPVSSLNGSYALTIGPAQGSVAAKSINYSPTESGYYYDSWPVNSAGVLDSSNQLAPPYTMAIEARERWVYFYLDGQLVSVAPRTAIDPQNATTTDVRPFVTLVASPGDSIQLDYIVMRRTTGPMNGGQPGDYLLPSPPSPGGLQGTYYDTTLAYGPNGTLAGGQQLTQYGAIPPTMTPGVERTDSGLFFASGNVSHLAPPSPPSLSSVAARSTAGLASSANTYYKVTALNGVGETTPSTEAVINGAAALSPPTGLAGPSYGGQLGAPGSLRIASITWDPSHLGVPLGTNSYQVTAVDAHGETTGSNIAQVNITEYYDTVGIYWNTVPGAIVYNIYRITGFGAPGYIGGVWAGSGTTQGYFDNGAHSPTSAHPPGSNTTGSGSLANSTHYWKVTAVNAAGGETTASAEISGSPGFANAIAIISWGAVAGAVSYNVYRSDTVSGAEGYVGNTTATGWGDYGTIAPGRAPPGSNTTSFYNATISWAPVAGATSYKVYRGTSSGSEALLATTTATSLTDTGSAAAGAPPVTNTASIPVHGTPAWFPAAIGNAQAAYIRWSGAIYLPLGAGSPVTVSLTSTNLSQVLRVGRTRQGEAVCMSDSGYKAGILGTSQVDFPSEQLAANSPDLRTILGSRTGWYPVVFEYIYRISDPTTSTVGFTYDVGGAGTVPSPYVLSPYGCFNDQIAEADSHFDVLQTAIGQAFAYNWVCQPQALESGFFPGSIVPLVRVGRDTDFVLDDDQASNPQETSTVEDNATTVLAQAQGLGGSSSGSLTAEAFNFAVMAGHPFNLTESENLPATTQLALLVLQMETLLGLRSAAWQNVTADAGGQRSMQDSWPLSGNLQEFDWQPGDGLKINLPQVGVVDLTPRQIMSLKRMMYPDGLGQNTASFRARPRNFAYTMRKFVKQFYSDRRTFQGQLTYVPGTQAVSPAFTAAPLPADTSLVRQATLTILSKTDTTTSFSVVVNGRATGLSIIQPGVLDLSGYIGRNNAVEPQMVVQLTNPATDGQASYMLSLLVLVPRI